jgi:hypothetical protein
VPDEPERKRLADRKRKTTDTEPRLSRGKALLDAGRVLPLPEVDLVYIIEILFDVGPIESGGMGQGPLSHGEIRRWMENMGICLQPWEIRLLRRLSRDYLVETGRAAKRDCPAPWAAVVAEIDREKVSQKVERIFG